MVPVNFHTQSKEITGNSTGKEALKANVFNGKHEFTKTEISRRTRDLGLIYMTTI